MLWYNYRFINASLKCCGILERILKTCIVFCHSFDRWIQNRPVYETILSSLFPILATVLSPLKRFFIYSNNVLFLIIFFIRCDQVPFSDHFTRSRPRTHCIKDDQSCKNIAWCFDKLWLLCLGVCTFSAHIHKTMQVTGFLLMLRPVHTFAFQNVQSFAFTFPFAQCLPVHTKTLNALKSAFERFRFRYPH